MLRHMRVGLGGISLLWQPPRPASVQCDLEAEREGVAPKRQSRACWPPPCSPASPLSNCMKYSPLLATIIAVAALSTTCLGEDSPRIVLSLWLYTAEVTYQENHDPAVIWLNDNCHLQVIYGDAKEDAASASQQLSFETVDRWPIGYHLTLAYSTAKGPVLLDPKSGRIAPIIGGLKQHPLELLLNRRLEHAESTLAIVSVYDENSKLWELEIERLFHVLLNARNVSAKTKAELRRLQTEWLQFAELHSQTAGHFMSLPQGTIWSINAVAHRNHLLRAYAGVIEDLLAPSQCIEPASSLN